MITKEILLVLDDNMKHLKENQFQILAAKNEDKTSRLVAWSREFTLLIAINL